MDGYTISLPAKIVIGVFVASVGLFLLAPSLIVVPMSFSGSDLLQFPPSSFSLRWWEEFFQSETWLSAARISILLGLATAFTAVPLTMMAAYATARLTGARSALLYGILLMPATIPPILVAVGLFFVLAQLELIGTFAGLWLGHTVFAIPVSYIVLSAGFSRFDFTLERAAHSLGASWGRTMLTVVIPELRYSMLAAGLLSFLTSLDEVIVAMFVSSGSTTTLTKLMFLALRDNIDPLSAVVSSIWIGVILLVAAILFIRRPRRP
jgi:putative spermidine/putrescine transport system permease protein